jgi:hypothetical protein
MRAPNTNSYCISFYSKLISNYVLFQRKPYIRGQHLLSARITFWYHETGRFITETTKDLALDLIRRHHHCNLFITAHFKIMLSSSTYSSKWVALKTFVYSCYIFSASHYLWFNLSKQNGTYVYQLLKQ